MGIHSRACTVLEARAWAEHEQLYAILDACDTPAVPAKVAEIGVNAVSLYRGMAEEEFVAIAPYLVAVSPEVFDWIAEKLWSEPWGIFVRGKSDMDGLRTHFRRFLFVKSPGGEDWYFRYYDPRILEQYLRTCTETELTEFFGPVSSFALTDQESYGLKEIGRAPFSLLKEAPAIRIQFKHGTG